MAPSRSRCGLMNCASSRLESAGVEPCHEVHECHLAGIGDAGEHALAEEDGTDPHAIEAAHELAVLPAFDAVAETGAMQLRVERLRMRPLIQVALRPAGPRGAGRNHGSEVGVDADLERMPLHRLAQRMRYAQTLEGDDPALVGLNPVERVVFGAFRHREDPGGIGPQQDLRRDRPGHQTFRAR